MKLLNDETGSIQMLGAVVGILITLIIAILVFYTIAGSVDTSDVDEQIRENVYGEGGTTWKNNTNYAENSTGDILDQSETFFQIAPIIAIVVVAAIILGYVSKIGE